MIIGLKKLYICLRFVEGFIVVGEWWNMIVDCLSEFWVDPSLNISIPPFIKDNIHVFSARWMAVVEPNWFERFLESFKEKFKVLID